MKSISSQRHFTFFPGITLGLLHGLSYVVHMARFRENEKLQWLWGKECQKNVEGRSDLQKEKETISWNTSPAAPLCSLSLPACSPLSHTHTHTHCTLGKLQSFAQIKSSYSYWQYYIEPVTGSYWGQALWEKGQQDSRVFFSFTTKQSIGSQNLFIIILNSCLNSSSFSSRNFGPCTNID